MNKLELSKSSSFSFKFSFGLSMFPATKYKYIEFLDSVAETFKLNIAAWTMGIRKYLHVDSKSMGRKMCNIDLLFKQHPI